ncbi:unnamed protein product [Sphagnum jensenii]|jgi:hypothetical protein|uniref:Uncharacterized protein n=1 Tax=Sphagnum jensenii TaxID=128206 RepID=A0ABP0XMI9_9BRYO
MVLVRRIPLIKFPNRRVLPPISAILSSGESAAPRAASSPAAPADVKTGVSATAADATSGSQSSRITVSR